MSQTKYLKGECSHCHGRLEFPAESTGTLAQCPHCGQETELMLDAPAVEPAIPRKTLVWTLIAVVVLVLGLGGALYALHLANKKYGKKPEAAVEPVLAPPQHTDTDDPARKAGFELKSITIQKVEGSSLVYAVGGLKNLEPRQRFGVTVKLELTNSAGEKLGTATDYQR